MMRSRKLTCALAVILSLVVAMTTGGVALAQQDADVAPQVPTLFVQAPRIVDIDESVPITVTELHTGDPIIGAEVWALQWPLVRPLATDAQPSVQSTVPPRWHYQFLGTTGEGGKVTPPPVFEKAGRFLIIATYSGYAPGLHVIIVKPKALTVQVPKTATVGEDVTIKVVDSDGEPVADAKLYALCHPVVPWLLKKAQLKSRPLDNDSLQKQGTLSNKPVISSEPSPLPEDEVGVSLEDLAVKRGEHLGNTNEDGELVHTFEHPGRYRIVAVKQGYAPGAAYIAVRPENELNALAIKGPRFAEIDEEVTLTVLERGGDSVVEGANVYALRLPLNRGIIDKVKPFMPELALQGGIGASLKALAINHGEDLGKTDENGQVTHAFDKWGWYLIVATKDGYIPGITYISIGKHRIQPQI